MPDSNAVISLKEDDLAGKPKDKIEEINVSESLITMVRTAVPKQDWKLTDETVENIRHNLAHGVPIEACAACVCVTPQTLHKWLKKGMEEIMNLPAEECEDPTALISNVSPYGKLFLAQLQAKGTLQAEIMDAIHDRMFEQHNEWLLTYLLERLDPETYNLKYKAEKMKAENNRNVNLGTQNFVNIQFVNGMEGRSEEDKKFLRDSLAQLHAKWDKSVETAQTIDVGSLTGDTDYE